MVSVGVIGVGFMGGGMVQSLIDRGRAVNIFDVRPEATGNFRQVPGVRILPNARSVGAESDIVISSVYSPADVEKALLDPEVGLLAGQNPGDICIETSTNTLQCIQRVELAYKDKGAHFLAAPVTGRPPEMTMMIGGDEAAFESSKEVLDHIAKHTIFLGTASAACVAKHVNQYMTYTNMIVACEGMVAAAKAGIPLERMAEILELGSGRSFMLPFALSEALGRQSPVTPAALVLIAKDVRLSFETLMDLGIPSDFSFHLNGVFREAEETLGQLPFPVILHFLARKYGVDPTVGFAEELAI